MDRRRRGANGYDAVGQGKLLCLFCFFTFFFCNCDVFRIFCIFVGYGDMVLHFSITGSDFIERIW